MILPEEDLLGVKITGGAEEKVLRRMLSAGRKGHALTRPKGRVAQCAR